MAGVFPDLGLTPHTPFLNGLVSLNVRGQILTDLWLRMAPYGPGNALLARQTRRHARPRVCRTAYPAVTVAPWYGQGERCVQITSVTAVWYHSGLPPVPIRWVLSRDPQGKFTPQALLSTQLEGDPVQILTWFVQRWQLETTFEEARAHLGIETQRQWSEKVIARTTPALFALYSSITVQPSPIQLRWYGNVYGVIPIFPSRSPKLI